MTVEMVSRHGSRSSLWSSINPRKSWRFSTDGLKDGHDRIEKTNSSGSGYGQRSIDMGHGVHETKHKSKSATASPQSRMMDTDTKNSPGLRSKEVPHSVDFNGSTGQKKSTTKNATGLLGSILGLSLGCGLGVISGSSRNSRRKFLVTPVSRSPSQELTNPDIVHDDVNSLEDKQQKKLEFDQLVTCSEDESPWTEKYQPMTLLGSINQNQTAVYLRHLISQGNCPHMLFSGPPGSGKRSLIRAMLQDLFGQHIFRVRSTTRSFCVQGGRLPNFLIPVFASDYHVEIDACSMGDFDVEILPLIIKNISYSSDSTPGDFENLYKVLVVYRADRLSNEAQRTLRRCIDTYGSRCKVILSSSAQLQEDHVLEELQHHCHYITLGPPTVNEITTVLQHIAQQEKLDLPISLAMRVAIQSKQNLKQAIISLQACRSHKYPFLDDQSVELGYWENDIVKIAVDIISEPTPKQLFHVHPKLQTLLLNSVPASLILKKLEKELLQNLRDQNLRNEISFWAQHFDSKITPGPESIYQLEGFVTKFMSIYKKYLNAGQELVVANAPSNFVDR